MDILNETTVVIYNSADLKQALEDTDYSYIYLGANIIMTTGITVNQNKTTLVIDGLYPKISPEIRTLTDQGGDAGTIMIASPLKITFQNLNIAGRNYFGVPRVADGAAGEGTVVIFQRVTYVGPQTTFHRNGLTRYLDCDITIQRTPGYSSAHEVAEVRWAEIGGKTKIRHGSTSNAVFWFYNTGSSLTILENARVEIETVHDFLRRSNDFPKIIVQPGASLSLTTEYGIPRDSGHRVSSFLVDRGATFRYIRTSTNGSASALYIDGAFTVNEGATVYMQADFGNNQQLIQFTSNSPGRGLYLNNPRSFVLYNSDTQTDTSAFRFAAVTTCPFTTGQVNWWRNATPMGAGAGGFTDRAPGRWHRRNWNMFQITSSAEQDGTTVDSCNLEESDIDPARPLSMLQFDEARVLSVGNLPLALDPVVSQYRRVSGRTDPEGQVLVEYAIDDVVRTVYAQADETGLFSAVTEEEIPAGTSVAVTANIPFLLTTVAATAQNDGTLEILQSPDLIKLLIRPMENLSGLLPREDPSAPVVISDTRVTLTPWELYSRIDGPLQTAQGDILNDGVVFSHEDEEPGSYSVLGEAFTLVHQGTSAAVEHPDYPDLVGKVIVWSSDRGVLGRINNPIRIRKEYTTSLIWEIRPVEEEDLI